MGSGLGWTTNNKRCRCMKCNKYQLVEWFKIFSGDAKCKSCGEKIDASCYIKIIRKGHRMTCSDCGKAIDDREMYPDKKCRDCYNKKGERK